MAGTMTVRTARVQLSTGIALNVAEAGREDATPVILLHGFPESHRTWRGLVPLLEDRFRLIMPDQRGFGASDKPQDVADYASDILVADIFALADALGVDQFALVGHDWGGAIAWAAAIGGNPRITRLGDRQFAASRDLPEKPDRGRGPARRQPVHPAFRQPGMEAALAAMGIETFFDKTFARHVDMTKVSAEERQRYIDDWSQPGALTAMLNWYRASKLVVPPMGITVPVPDLALRALPKITIPTLVIWGMQDKALLPLQLDGLDQVVDDLTVERLPDDGHFAPWEAPEAVAAALGPFLAEDSPARASGE